MNDIEQFGKWFHLNGLDFQLNNVDGRWRCLAWHRGEKSVLPNYWAGSYCHTAADAMLRCYEAVRSSQRRGTF